MLKNVENISNLYCTVAILLSIIILDEEGDYLSVSSDEELLQAWEPTYQNSGSGCLKLFVKVKKQENYGQQSNNHPGVICDGCDASINGIRYKCTQCPDFDLCSCCEEKKQHPADHEMICIKTPRARRHNAWIYPSRHCRSRPYGRFPFERFVFGAFPSSKKSDETTEKKESPSAEKAVKDHIARLASCFGLDPDVAKCYYATFCDDIHTKKDGNDEQNQKQKEKTTKSNDSDQNAPDSQTKEQKPSEAPKTIEDLVSDMATAFGVQQEFLSSFINPFLPQNARDQRQKGEDEKPTTERDCTGDDSEINKKDIESEETKTGDAEIVTEDRDDDDSTRSHERQEESDEKVKENTAFKEELETMVRGFSEQFGLPAEHQQNIQGGLESLLQGMFSFPNSQQQSPKSFKVRSKVEYLGL
jgi:Zinc finger, ZZ type./PB1 domain.